MRDEHALDETERLVLGDLLNRVLDKGVVISGDLTISVADIDLIRLGLNVVLSAAETELRHAAGRGDPRIGDDADPPLLPSEPGR